MCRPASVEQACYLIGLSETLSLQRSTSSRDGSLGKASTEAVQSEPFHGLELGPVLGRGAHGRVYVPVTDMVCQSITEFWCLLDRLQVPIVMYRHEF